MHAANVARHARTELAMVYDVHAPAAEAVAAREGATIAASAEEVFASKIRRSARRQWMMKLSAAFFIGSLSVINKSTRKYILSFNGFSKDDRAFHHFYGCYRTYV